MNQAQRARWIKYGGNVVLSCVLAIGIAVLATYAAERHPKRIDATEAGLYSLKPQTIKIIHDLKTPIRLVSLYTQSKPPQSADEQDSGQAPVVAPEEAAQTVNDLLEEYANKGNGITVETIDPVTSPGKVDDLIEEVEAKYGGEIKKYREFVQSFKGTVDQISKIADPEVKAVGELSVPQNTDPAVIKTLQYAFVSVETFPKELGDLQDALQKPLHQKPPDYKGAADAINGGMANLSALLDAVIQNFTTLQTKGGLPPDVAAYMKESLPHYQELKKVVDDSVSRAKKLGDLKLDTLRSALRERNTILVMSDKEWRAINFDQVWQPAGQVAMAAVSDRPPRPRFAGEQQVTSAILALASGGQKPKVAIVRAGGQPLTQSMNPFGGGGDAPLGDAAARLGLYNYDVVEKDLTGQFAAQSGGGEPTDDEIKNATWIVWGFKGQQSEFGESPTIAPQVAEHLKQGGSAVILTGVHQEGFADALRDWGVTVRTDAIVVHEKIANGGGDSSDIVEQVLRLPFVFDLHEYGDHPLAKPLGSLEGLFANMSPVTIEETKGYKATSLLPIPTAPSAPRSWGTVNLTVVEHNEAPPADANTDISPVYAGAAVEKFGGGRLVVIAAGDFAENRWLELTSQQIDPNAPPVLRFPGNGELFTDAVFWASHQDTLIDISPAAMDIGRIHDMSPATLRFWRVGVLLIGLPGLVLAIGAGVYLQRRD